MLGQIKLILNIDNEAYDEILELMIEDAIMAVLNYCNIKDLPKQLELVVREIVANSFNTQLEGNVSSIKRGDTQINYSNTIDINSFSDKQKSSMNRFRRITTR